MYSRSNYYAETYFIEAYNLGGKFHTPALEQGRYLTDRLVDRR